MKNVRQVVQKVFAAIGAVAVFAFGVLAVITRGRRRRPGVDLRGVGRATADVAEHHEDAIAAIDTAGDGIADVKERLDSSAERVANIQESNDAVRGSIDDIIAGGPVRRGTGREIPEP